MTEKAIYKTSDSNFCAYLMYLKYNMTEIKVIENENGKPKVYLLFEGDTLIEFNNIYKQYKFDEVKLNLFDFMKYKDETFKMVRSVLGNYYTKKEE
ncbi:hypothetical protein [Dehalobacter restrictus]|uniref:DUF5659 domain-containing protein n=1 Tax=Dehalobacter restrictus TaxID=55583 RepID=A0A857DFK4_9FIRM|nr:hypothetical protein [Dehalobacter restrictus]QGZ99417.1 hypothetical protein GQ588_01425 [Dehalobacter restrictus]